MWLDIPEVTAKDCQDWGKYRELLDYFSKRIAEALSRQMMLLSYLLMNLIAEIRTLGQSGAGTLNLIVSEEEQMK